VLVLAVGLVLLACGLAAAAAGAVSVARHQAQVAADLGALAGAGRAGEGAEPACARAARFVEANGARLVACELSGLDLSLQVEVPPPAFAGITRPAVATARAGPVRADDSRGWE
jgi:secretion/DNA translocation related TadE-like protein